MNIIKVGLIVSLSVMAMPVIAGQHENDMAIIMKKLAADDLPGAINHWGNTAGGNPAQSREKRRAICDYIARNGLAEKYSRMPCS